MKNQPVRCLLLRIEFNTMAQIFPSNSPRSRKKAILVKDIPNKMEG